MDGGVVLLVAFLFLLFSYVKPIQKIRHDKSAMAMSNLCLIAMLFIMIFESLTEYYYIFVFLSILAMIPIFVADFSGETEQRGKEKKRAKKIS